jgi:RNA polymerase sigma factor (sigma-70 family)
MDVFVELYARRETIDQQTAPAYLKRSVVNRTLTLLTRAARDRDAVDRATREHLLPGAESGAIGDDNAVAQQQFVVGLINALPPQQKVAVVLRYYADLADADIADAMGVSIGTVKSYLSRARERMQRDLPQSRSEL